MNMTYINHNHKCLIFRNFGHKPQPEADGPHLLPFWMFLSALVLLLRSCWLIIFIISFAGSDPVCVETCKGVNEYWSGVEANGTQLVLADGSLSPGVGDVLLIIQVQGGTINNSDDLNYGANNNTGNGFTDVGLAGQYEFAEVASVANSSIILLSDTLLYTYSSTNNNRFQAIKVALCKEATVENPMVPPWNGTVGGILVVIAERILLGNVSLEGKGFRGGPKFPITGGIIGLLFDPQRFRDNTTATRVNDTSVYNAPKGEGFIGFPRFPIPQGGLSDTTYPEGLDCAKGAPGNAGGGSNWRDSGGGGGANGGKGGDGALYVEDPQAGSPGLGGAPAPSNASSRIFLGKATRSNDLERSDGLQVEEEAGLRATTNLPSPIAAMAFLEGVCSIFMHSNGSPL